MPEQQQTQQSQKNELKKAQNNSPTQEDTSPNLLQGSIASMASAAPIYQNLFKSLFFMIVTLQLAFVVIVSINIYLNINLSGLNYRVSELQSQMLSRSGILQESRLISTKISLYKTLAGEKSLVSKMMHSVSSSLPEGVTVEDARFDIENQGSFTVDPITGEELGGSLSRSDLEIKSPDALTFALFINSLLEKENVISVTLKEANLEISTEKYVVNLEVNFVKR